MISLLENPAVYNLFSEVSEPSEDLQTLPLLDEELPSHFLPFLKDESSLKLSQADKQQNSLEEESRTETAQTKLTSLILSQSMMTPSKTEIDYIFEQDAAFDAQVRKRKRIDSIGSVCSTLFEDQPDFDSHRIEGTEISSPLASPSAQSTGKRHLFQEAKSKQNGILTDMLQTLQTKRASSLVEEIFEMVDQGPFQGQEKKRGKKTKQQLKILRCYYEKCKEWNNEILQLISRQTGLTASQLYKWNWDQKNRVH